MKSFKKLLGLLLAAAIITSMLAVPTLADGILSVSTNAAGGAAYANSDRYFFDMSYQMGTEVDGVKKGSASFDSNDNGTATATWLATDPLDTNNKVLQVASTGSGAAARLNFQTDGVKYQSEGPQIIGFDFYIDSVTPSSTVTTEATDLLKVNAYGQSWNGDGNKVLNIRKDASGNTVIKTYDGSADTNTKPGSTTETEGREIQLDKWYTCYLYTDWTYGTLANESGKYSNNFASFLYMSEKGAGFANAWYVSMCYSDQTNKDYNLSQPVAAYIRGYNSDMTYYVDNLFIDSVVSVDDTKVYAERGESAEVDFYVAPGFTSASVTAFGEEIAVTDNGTGYYTLGVTVPQDAELGANSVTVNAVYPPERHYHSHGNTMTATKSPLVVMHVPSYQYMTVSSTGEAFSYNFDDGKTNVTMQLKVDNDTSANVVKSTDNGYDFENNSSDKSLKIEYTGGTANTGVLLLGEYNQARPTKPVNAMLKFKADLKFDSDAYGLNIQNKSDNGWANYPLVDTTTKKFIGTDIALEAGKWYRLEFIYNLAENTIDSYVNGVAFADEPTDKILATNFVSQFSITPPAGADNLRKGTIWVDNISKEIAPIYKGVKNYNPVLEDNSAFEVEFEDSVLDNLFTAEPLYSDGTAAGTASFATADSVTTLTVTPDTSFNAERDITLVIKTTGGEVVDTKTYIMKDNDTQAISEITLTQDSEKVYANIKAMSEDAVGTLYIVGYNSDYTRLTNVSITPVTSSLSLKNFEAKLTKSADDVNYKAFLWSPSYAPVEEAAPLAKN